MAQGHAASHESCGCWLYPRGGEGDWQVVDGRYVLVKQGYRHGGHPVPPGQVACDASESGPFHCPSPTNLCALGLSLRCPAAGWAGRCEEHTSELQSRENLVGPLLPERRQ